MNLSVRSVEARTNLVGLVRGRSRELIASREVLTNLVRKELKVRYKNSSLGFLWSMLNPVLYLVVFWVVFNFFLPGNIPNFVVFLLAGLLPWTLFASALSQATGSVVGNADLVKKVYFPRELLPLSAIGAGLVHFLAQFLVLVAFLLIIRYPFAGKASLLLPLALSTELLLIAGLGFLLCAVNVFARDIQYLLELALLAWFWMTPIVYPSAMVADRMAEHSIAGVPLLGIYLANPMARVVLAFQRGIYGIPVVGGEPARILIEAPLGWYLQGIGYAAAGAAVLFALGWWVFHSMDARFAEEL
jgi:ABC-2 type transport system permease protein